MVPPSFERGHGPVLRAGRTVARRPVREELGACNGSGGRGPLGRGHACPGRRISCGVGDTGVVRLRSAPAASGPALVMAWDTVGGLRRGHVTLSQHCRRTLPVPDLQRTRTGMGAKYPALRFGRRDAAPRRLLGRPPEVGDGSRKLARRARPGP